ncbi:MAG: hypothetical protein H7301_10460 [Cryobacterium sp.]|nr:hypothetical protein [Oligoflexia bacterium]
MTNQSIPLSTIHPLHERACELAKRFKWLQSELIEVLQCIDQERTFYELGYSSLFQYVTGALGFSESVAWNLILVARKAREILELKAALRGGTLTLSSAA